MRKLFTFLSVGFIVYFGLFGAVEGYGQAGGTIAADQTICAGQDPAAFTSTQNPTGGAVTAFWQKSTTAAGGCLIGFVDIPGATSNTFNDATPLTQTTTYRRRATQGGNDFFSNCITVTVNPLPNGSLSSSTPTICIGGSPTLTWTSSTGGTNFNLTINGSVFSNKSSGVAFSINSGAPALANPIITTTYTITSIIDNNGCVGTSFTDDTAKVTVNSNPTVTTVTPQSTCSGNVTNIPNTSTPSGSTFTWTIGAITGGVTGATAGSGNTIAQTLSVPGTTAGSVIYNVTATLNGCSGSSKAITVNVNPKPTVTTVTPQSTCSGNATSIPNTSNISGSTFSWTLGTITGGVTGASASNGATIAQTLSVPGTTAGSVIYNVTATLNGCSGSSLPITVNVNPKPNVTTVTPQSTCSGDLTNISNTSNISGSTFAWTLGTITGGVTGASAANGNIIAQTLSVPGTSVGSVVYNVTATLNGCSGSSNAITVNVNPKAIATTASQSTCSGDLTNIPNTSSTSGSTFAWTLGTITGGVTGASAGNGNSIAQTLSVPGTSSGTVIYNVTAAINGCSGAAQPITITVNPKPTVTTVTPQNVCSGDLTNISNTSNISGSTFAWTIGAITGGVTGASAANGNTIAQTLIYPGTSTGSVIYNVTATLNGCSGSSLPITVNVKPKPTVTTVTPQSTCNGDLTNIPNTSSLTGSTFAWTIGAISGGVTGATAGNGNTIAQTLSVPGSSPGSVIYNVTATLNGCSGASNAITVNVNPKPDISTFNVTAQDICVGASSLITLAPTSLATLTYTVFFHFTGPNVALGNLNAPMIVPPSTFSTPALSLNGVETIIIDQIGLGSCVSVLTNNNFVSFNIEVQPVSPIVSPNIAAGNICETTTLSGPITPGFGGVGCTDITEYSTTGLSGPWIAIVDPFSIPLTGIDSIMIRSFRDCPTGTGCNSTSPVIQTWYIYKPSVLPSSIIGDTSLCNGDSTTLSLAGGSLGTDPTTTPVWNWYSATGSCTGTLLGTGPTLTWDTVATTVPVTTTIFVKAEGGGAPCADPAGCVQVDVTVNPIPQIPIIPTITICSGDTINYDIVIDPIIPSGNPNISSGVSYSWTTSGPSQISGNFPQTLDPNKTISAVLVNSTTDQSFTVTYTITATFINTSTTPSTNCSSTTQTLTVVVNPAAPQPVISDLLSVYPPYVAKNILCGGSTNIGFKLDSIIKNINYFWTSSPSAVEIQNNTDSVSGNSIINFGDAANPYQATIKVFATNLDALGKCAGKSDSLDITILPGDEIEEKEVILRTNNPGNGPDLLIYSDNTVDGYKWGVDVVNGGTDILEQKFLKLKYYQVFVPDTNEINVFKAGSKTKLDTVKYNFWVMVYKIDKNNPDNINDNDTCYSRVYYNGPFAIKNGNINPPAEAENVTLSAFPNPNNGAFDLMVSGNIYGNVKIKFMNTLGQKILEKQVEKIEASQKFSLNARNIPSGLYMIRVEGLNTDFVVTKVLIY